MFEAIPPRRRRVLVVDDCRYTTASMALILGWWGHEAREAHDGPAALAEAETFRPDVVLLDLALPGMDGCEVVRRLRRERGPALVVSVSGFADDGHADAARAAGCDLHLTKPVDLDELRELLAAGRVRAPELVPS